MRAIYFPFFVRFGSAIFYFKIIINERTILNSTSIHFLKRYHRIFIVLINVVMYKFQLNSIILYTFKSNNSWNGYSNNF